MHSNPTLYGFMVRTRKTLRLPLDDVHILYHSNSNNGMAVKGLVVKTEYMAQFTT